MKNEQRRMKHIWMVEEARTSTANETTKSFWTKIGVAFENEDGSLSLHLAAVPVTGKMIVRDAQPPAVSIPSRTRGAA